MVERIARHTAIVCALMVALAAMWKLDFATPAGVAAGGLLVPLSVWATPVAVDAWSRRRSEGDMPRKKARFQLVKFFTRYVMLALAAYVMMMRLRVDPVAMLVGVSSLGAAVAVEAMRG